MVKCFLKGGQGHVVDLPEHTAKLRMDNFASAAARTQHRLAVKRGRTERRSGYEDSRPAKARPPDARNFPSEQ